MNEERFEYLLNRHFDGALLEEEKRELESLLLSRPQARTLFWKRARFHALLRRQGRENWGRRLAVEPNVPAAGPALSRWRTSWQRAATLVKPAGWWAVAALAMILAFILIHSSTDKDGKGPKATVETTSPADESMQFDPASGTTGQGVATILRAVDVKWSGNRRRPGNVLGPGWLKFASGLVELQFHRGARVVIEGPAEFELITDMQARCVLGRVRAEVPPPAVGFEILSPSVRVVDRGTAFGLNVQDGGLAEVYVFSGRVDFATTQPPETPRELRQGNAVRVDSKGAVSDIPSVQKDFTTAEVVEKKATTAMALRYAAWRAETDRLRKDPSLLLQYTFEGEAIASRQLTNLAPGALSSTNGTIIGCNLVEGRWPGKSALDFKQVGDRIRFALPRTHEQLTCLMWVRLDAMDRPYTALMMSGDATIGEPQWQLRSRGMLSFGKRKEKGWGYGKLFIADSKPILEPSRCGSWMQLAFVYDGHAKTLSHYLDGQCVTVTPMDGTVPLQTKALEIGNWTPTGGEPMEPIRAFNGRMDEFLMFSRALRADEIEHMWETGRPL